MFKIGLPSPQLTWTWWLSPTRLKNDGVRQLGWVFPCSKPPTRDIHRPVIQCQESGIGRFFEDTIQVLRPVKGGDILSFLRSFPGTFPHFYLEIITLWKFNTAMEHHTFNKLNYQRVVRKHSTNSTMGIAWQMTRFNSDDWFSLHPKKRAVCDDTAWMDWNKISCKIPKNRAPSHLLRHNPRSWIPNYPYRKSWVFSQARNLGSHRLAGSCTRRTKSCLQKVPTDSSSIRMYMFTINHPNVLSMSLFFIIIGMKLWAKQCHKPSPSHHKIVYRCHRLLLRPFPKIRGLWPCFNHIKHLKTSWIHILKPQNIRWTQPVSSGPFFSPSRTAP